MEGGPMRYMRKMAEVYYMCWDILDSQGLFFLNIDNGRRKDRNLLVTPWDHIPHLRKVGFQIIMTLIWYDPNKIPTSSQQLLKHNYEPVFVLAKQKDYHFYKDEIRVPYSNWYKTLEKPDGMYGSWGDTKFTPNKRGADPGDVWKIVHARGSHAKVGADRRHCAPFPEELVERIVKLATRPGDIVYDPFAGSGTVGVVCKRLGRHFLGSEIIKRYVELARERIEGEPNGE
jgi:DNA modification methylase